MFRLLLTLFYGQFIANAIYSNIIHGLPQLIEKPDQYYPILRVTLGVCMLALAVLAVVAVTLKLIIGPSVAVTSKLSPRPVGKIFRVRSAPVPINFSSAFSCVSAPEIRSPSELCRLIEPEIL